MRVGIIGSGRIGGTLARHLVKAGHAVAIANSRNPDTLAGLEHDLGRLGRGGVHAANVPRTAAFGEVAVLAMPFGAYRELPAEPFAGRAVIDATNYFPERDGAIDELDDADRTSSELIARHLPGARVVKAFNAMRADHLLQFARHGGSQDRYGIPVAADDNDAKRIVFDLVNDVGFEPVDAGGLVDGGRRYGPGTDLFLADLPASRLADALDAPASRPSD